MMLPGEVQNFEEFALGEGTSSYFARYQGYPIHLDNLEDPVIDSLVEGWRLRGEKPVVLILGNSQMHGINQYVHGQVSYNMILFDSLQNKVDLIAQSVPNANMQEFLYAYLFWKKQLPIRKVILPVFFDDLREDGIRFAYASVHNQAVLLDDSSAHASSWNAMVHHAYASASSMSEQSALVNTTQEEVELALTKQLEARSEVWRRRPELRGMLFTGLHNLRNHVFGINPQSVRRMIPVVYEKNLMVLDLLAQVTEYDGVDMYIYIPPIRSDVATPYDPAEYTQFKDRIVNWAREHQHVAFADFDTRIGGEYWGFKKSTALKEDLEYDFMHFSYKGHQLLAESLQNFMSIQEK